MVTHYNQESALSKAKVKAASGFNDTIKLKDCVWLVKIN